MSAPRILLVGGGSAGHLAPLVAVWREIERARPDASVFALCTDRGDDSEFLEREGLAFTAVPYPWRSWLLPWTLSLIFLRAWSAIRDFQPTVVFSKGGLVSVPVCLAARLHGVPVVVHESDAVMGLGTSVVRFLATTVCLGLTPNRLPPRAIVTGNPVRPEILKGTRERGLELTHFDGQKPILFVTGGSQGAQAINDAVVTHLPALLKLVDVIHLTGKGKICAEAQPGYWPAETSGGAMGDLYACATLALIRGGAGSISECAATGVPAMIVPIEGLANDHQVHNAERAAAAGGFVLVRQKELPATLVPRIAGLLSNPAQLEAMSESARSLYQPDASARIAAAILAASNA